MFRFSNNHDCGMTDTPALPVNTASRVLRPNFAARPSWVSKALLLEDEAAGPTVCCGVPILSKQRDNESLNVVIHTNHHIQLSVLGMLLPCVYQAMTRKPSPLSLIPSQHHHHNHTSPTPHIIDTAMSPLESLPQEISTDILSHLPQSDLFTTCSLSRTLSAIAQPLLYSAPVLVNDNHTATASIRMFLRTLLSPRGSHLATLVRSVHVHSDRAWFQHEADNPADSALLAAPATRHGYQDPSTPDAHLTLLLQHLPCLRALRITSKSTRGATAGFMEDYHALIENPPPGLRHLREFRSATYHRYGALSASSVLAVLRLPRIRNVHFRPLAASTVRFGPADVVAGSSTVTDLRLACGTLTQGSLEAILALPAALERFSCTSICGLLDLGRALQPLKASLTQLDVQGVRLAKPLGPLRDWPALHTLRVRCSEVMALEKRRGQYVFRMPCEGGPSLVGYLPGGLCVLQIYREDSWAAEAEVRQAVEVLRRKREMVPRLVRLVMGFSVRRGGVYRGLVESACGDAGVALVVTGWH